MYKFDGRIRYSEVDSEPDQIKRDAIYSPYVRTADTGDYLAYQLHFQQ